MKLVQQAYLVWAERGEPAYKRYIATGSFGDAQVEAEPYRPDVVKAIVASGLLT